MKAEYAELSIYEALAVVQRDAPVIKKTEEVDTTKEGGKMRYSFAGLNTVWAAIGGLMDDLGFVWTAAPVIRSFEGGQTRLVLEGTLYHIPSKGVLKGEYPLKGERPQEIGSGMTYGRRYLLVALLNLRVAQDDDDAVATEENAQLSPSQQAQASRPRKASAQRAPATARQAPPPMPEGGAPAAAGGLSRARQSAMFAALGELGLTERGTILEYVNETLARHGAPAVGSSKELSDESAGWIIERAKAADAGPPESEG